MDSWPVDVVLLDLDMPVMYGISFLKHLRGGGAKVRNSEVPVVVLSAHSGMDNIIDVVHLGVHGFIAKPFSKVVMASRLESALTSGPIDPRTVSIA